MNNMHIKKSTFLTQAGSKILRDPGFKTGIPGIFEYQKTGFE
jgi:hypothetical protein